MWTHLLYVIHLPFKRRRCSLNGAYGSSTTSTTQSQTRIVIICRWGLTIITVLAMQLGWGLWLIPYDFARLGWAGGVITVTIVACACPCQHACRSREQESVNGCSDLGFTPSASQSSCVARYDQGVRGHQYPLV